MTTTSTLDPNTTNAIREALGAASRGLHQQAVQIGERALADGGDTVALNAMLGMLRCQSGDLETGVEHLKLAHGARPNDQKIATNLAMALQQLERYPEAYAILTDDLARKDPSLQLERMRGFLAQSVDDYPAAIASYERVVAAAPADWEAWNNLGNARRAADDIEGATTALRKAAELSPDSRPVRLNLCTALIQSGDWNAAEVELQHMAVDFPDDPNPLRELHLMLKEWGYEDDALKAIEGALERAPDDVELLLCKASQLSQMINSSAAEGVYRRVLELDPDNALGHVGLAVCFDLTNQTKALAELVPEAERKGVGPNALNFIRAYDHRRAKRFAEGLAAMADVPEDLENSRRANLMGQLLEGVGRYDEAFEQYAKMNELMAAAGARPLERAAGYRNMIRERHEAMTEEWVARWREETSRDPRPAPVFLFGFPRSGTTLLDTMLMGHPSIEVLEEEPTLHKAFEIFKDYENMPVASDQLIQEARDAYFETAKSKTPLKPGNLLVDKSPLAINAVPFIRRLFPDARFILALRHPCDVILSCYVTNFRMNDGMANFANLETGADLYDISFSYFERVQSLMPTPTHTVMYEKVVADKDRELRSLFNFLELDWHDAVLDHQTTALGRGRIKTASYAQVVEPIYQRSAGRWQNYRKHLEPIFPMVRPWVEKFGYSLDPAPAGQKD
jgi:tetratricopeptide (TPR) repeat protein